MAAGCLCPDDHSRPLRPICSENANQVWVGTGMTPSVGWTRAGAPGAAAPRTGPIRREWTVTLAGSDHSRAVAAGRTSTPSPLRHPIFPMEILCRQDELS
jgi:hypothetical protein